MSLSTFVKSRNKRPLTFGKYKGRTPKWVARIDPAYVVWMYEKVSPSLCTPGLYRKCLQANLYLLESDEDSRAADLHYGMDGW